MKIKIEKAIFKRNDKIQELFYYQPQNRYMERRQGSINYVLFYLINRLSISPEYTLDMVSDTVYTHERIFHFEENKKIPIRYLSFEFQYMPFTGKRYCRKCTHYKNHYCDFKEQKLEYDYYANCFGYFEKSIIKLDLEKLKNIKIFQE